jgi:hypothetical protein
LPCQPDRWAQIVRKRFKPWICAMCHIPA